MDFAITNFIFKTFENNKCFAVISKIITYLGEWWAVCLIIAFLLVFKKTRNIGLRLIPICLSAYLFNNLLLKNVIARERPYVQNTEWVSMLHIADYKFPNGYSFASGHATATMALAMGVVLQNKKVGLLVLPYPILVGLSRICLCVHFFTDVLVGWLIGLTFAIMVNHIINCLKNRRNNNEKIGSSNIK